MKSVLSSGIGLLVVALVFAGPASASKSGVGTPVRVPDNPLANSSTECQQLVTQQTALGSKNYADAEVEPYLATDPTNPNHLIASVQQDRWSDGGSNGLTNAVSFDGGASWQLASTQPAFSICEGAAPGTAGYFGRATDPWVSFSSDGKVAYSIADIFNADGPAFGGASSIVISRSVNGGVVWQPPVTAQVDASSTVLNDKESVKGDPVSASKAYAVWDRLVSPNSNANPDAFTFSPAFRGPAMFSKTSDSGVTWTPGRAIYDPGENNQTIANQILTPTAGPAKGQLIDGFTLILNKGGIGNNRSQTSSVAIIRSTDGGSTWSGATIAAPIQLAHVFIGGKFVRTSDQLPEFAAGPAGNLYATWQDGRFTAGGTPKIAFSMSTDGGVTWSSPIRVDQSPGDVQAFTPQITVRADGTVAVAYYDLENATPTQPGLTDEFLVKCAAECTDQASWTTGGETRLSTSGSFDMLSAPVSRGPFVGDYEGLAATGTRFDSAFVMARPIATSGPTDLFSNSAP
jgi:hypothetical protein